MLNTHVRDNLLFLKSDPVIARALPAALGDIGADSRGTSYTAVTNSVTALSSIAIPADIGACYVELWSHKGFTFIGPPGGGNSFSYELGVSEASAGSLINAASGAQSSTHEGIMAPGGYWRTDDLTWAGTTRTITITVVAVNCLGILYQPTIRIMRSY